jgi:hypothetical protein
MARAIAWGGAPRQGAHWLQCWRVCWTRCSQQALTRHWLPTWQNVGALPCALWACCCAPRASEQLAGAQHWHALWGCYCAPCASVQQTGALRWHAEGAYRGPAPNLRPCHGKGQQGCSAQQLWGQPSGKRTGTASAACPSGCTQRSTPGTSRTS